MGNLNQCIILIFTFRLIISTQEVIVDVKLLWVTIIPQMDQEILS
jgi:hypothetical protein